MCRSSHTICACALELYYLSLYEIKNKEKLNTTSEEKVKFLLVIHSASLETFLGWALNGLKLVLRKVQTELDAQRMELHKGF